MKQSAVDKAIEALEAKKDAQDKIIEMAIQELIAQRAPRQPQITSKIASVNIEVRAETATDRGFIQSESSAARNKA